MRRLLKALFFVLSLSLISCSETKSGYEELHENIDFLLRANKNGKLSVKIPINSRGVLVISTPYAIGINEPELVLAVGKTITKQMSDAVLDDSAFHLFYVDAISNRLVLRKKWTAPPVVFNKYLMAKFSNKDNSLVFNVSDSFLTDIKATRSSLE